MRAFKSSFYCFVLFLVSSLAPVAKSEAALVYVVNVGSPGVIQVIDTTSNTVISTIPMPITPPDIVTNGGTIVFSPDRTLAYLDVGQNGVTNNHRVYVLNTTTNTVIATITLDNSALEMWETISPNGQFLYVTDNDNAAVSVIDTSLNAVIATVTVGTNPFGSAIKIGRAHV